MPQQTAVPLVLTAFQPVLPAPPSIESVIDLLVCTVLAADMDPAARDHLRAAARGDRSALRVAVLAGLGSGELARVGGRWTWTGRRAAPDTRAVADLNLTRREQEILVVLSEGLTAQAIARRLGLSPRTVAKYQQRIYRKFGTSDRLTTVLRAQRLGLLHGGGS
jgi:DNA-binding NarL/FixJ family response regulator